MPQSRVLSIRFNEDEYDLLHALSTITGIPLNSIVRQAVVEKASREVNSDDYEAKATEARRRLEEADRALRQRVLDVSSL
jgi:predicted DNA-binding protein